MMKKVEHKRCNYENPNEGVTVNTADISNFLPTGTTLQSGEYLTFLYEGGGIATGKVSRDGRTVYILLKNFVKGFRLPTRNRKVFHGITAVVRL